MTVIVSSDIQTAARTAAQPGVSRTLTYPQIDVLRGFAALSVVVYHVIEHRQWTEFPVSGPLLWFRIGWMGVDLFFVISGLVIALAAFAMIDRIGGATFRLPFMKRRFARIAPLHYLTCLAFIAFSQPQLLYSGGFPANLLSHLGFFHNIYWKWAGSINGQNWSIGVEMQFYLLIAALAPFLRTCRWWIIPAVALPVAWVWRYGCFVSVPVDPELGVYFRFHASTQLPGTLDEFAAGILLARFLRSSRWTQFRDYIATNPWAPLLAAVAAVWLTTHILLTAGDYWTTLPVMTFWRTLESAAFALVILTACCLNQPLALGLTRPLRYLGTISYGIYLWHLPVVLAVKQVPDLPQMRGLVMTVLLTVALAAWSWHYFERQFLIKS